MRATIIIRKDNAISTLMLPTSDASSGCVCTERQSPTDTSAGSSSTYSALVRVALKRCSPVAVRQIVAPNGARTIQPCGRAGGYSAFPERQAPVPDSYEATPREAAAPTLQPLLPRAGPDERSPGPAPIRHGEGHADPTAADLSPYGECGLGEG